MKTIALLWGPFGHRLDELSAAVGGKRISITLLYGPRYFAPIRYLALFIMTLILLLAESPDVVYAQNPPVFCPLTSLLYCRVAGKRLVVDHHSVWRVKTIGGPVGRAIGYLESVVARSADANTAPHGVWARELSAMGARSVLVVHDHVERNPYGRDERLRRGYAQTPLIAVASHGGHPLERMEAEISAASRFETLTLLVTGPANKLAGRLEKLPPNIRYLGMLPMDDYLRLKASCDFALNITDEPFTLSHVLFEYAASALPVVSNRQAVVEEVFGDSLAYVNSSDVTSVSAGIRLLAGDPAKLVTYRSGMARMFDKLAATRSREVAALKDLISTGRSAQAKAPA
ncbi:MAG: glycosyltransferase [Nitrososphaerales archaeon]|nr:glycosyltransferase [Nitrososphaerales archaeon]